MNVSFFNLCILKWYWHTLKHHQTSLFANLWQITCFRWFCQVSSLRLQKMNKFKIIFYSYNKYKKYKFIQLSQFYNWSIFLSSIFDNNNILYENLHFHWIYYVILYHYTLNISLCYISWLLMEDSKLRKNSCPSINMYKII